MSRRLLGSPSSTARTRAAQLGRERLDLEKASGSIDGESRYPSTPFSAAEARTSTDVDAVGGGTREHAGDDGVPGQDPGCRGLERHAREHLR